MKTYSNSNNTNRLCCWIVILAFSLAIIAPVFSETRTWSGAEEDYWSVAINWFTEGVPAVTDDIFIDYKDVIVRCADDFYAKSITLGGRYVSALVFEDFVFGTIDPAGGDYAIKLRKNSHLVIKGSGLIKLKGPLVVSDEEILYQEPSFLSWVE